jgi:hypothetical protein
MSTCWRSPRPVDLPERDERAPQSVPAPCAETQDVQIAVKRELGLRALAS